LKKLKTSSISKFSDRRQGEGALEGKQFLPEYKQLFFYFFTDITLPLILFGGPSPFAPGSVHLMKIDEKLTKIAGNLRFQKIYTN